MRAAAAISCVINCAAAVAVAVVCGEHNHNRSVYEGQAVVINGLVTAMSGPQKEKWGAGTFEHVVEFYGARQTINITPIFRDPDLVTGALDPNVPWVQDKTYK